MLNGLSGSSHCVSQLVTYKWPKWLRRQTEKQRLIWAYARFSPVGNASAIFVLQDTMNYFKGCSSWGNYLLEVSVKP